jgi:hypothetical protein
MNLSTLSWNWFRLKLKNFPLVLKGSKHNESYFRWVVTVHFIFWSDRRVEGSIISTCQAKQKAEGKESRVSRDKTRKRGGLIAKFHRRRRWGRARGRFLECFLENLIEIPFIFISPHPSSAHSIEVILACFPYFPVLSLHVKLNSMVIYNLNLWRMKDQRESM